MAISVLDVRDTIVLPHVRVPSRPALATVPTGSDATGARRLPATVLAAGLIGILGGLIGLALGALVVFLANEAGRSSGTSLFDLTPGTAIFAVSFSTILGMVAGVIPAWNAARLDPVAALRYE